MNSIKKAVIFPLLFVSSLTIMLGAVIAPSLVGIVDHLNFAFSPSWLITLPSLGVVVSGPFVGRLFNNVGNRKALMLGLLPYGVLGVDMQ